MRGRELLILCVRGNSVPCAGVREANDYTCGDYDCDVLRCRVCVPGDAPSSPSCLLVASPRAQVLTHQHLPHKSTTSHTHTTTIYDAYHT
jgi:hypothetical protein